MLGLLLMVFASHAGAIEPPRAKPTEPVYKLSAEYRLLGLGLTDLPVDETGTLYGQKRWVEERLRVLGEIGLPARDLRFELGVDLFSGQLAGDITSVGAATGHLLWPRHHLDAFRRFEPRRAMVAWRTPVGELRVGHMTSNWGLGILANSGEHLLEFDDQRLGDLVERVAFATMPLENLFTALAFDVVYRDPNASLIDGDLGFNVIGSVFYRTSRSFLGFYGVYRHQRDRDGDTIDVGVFDVAGSITRKLGRTGLVGTIGFEGVLFAGSTSRLRLDLQPEGVDVLAAGGAVRASVEHEPTRLGFTFEVGLASGDNDRGDATARAFTFHPDYRVGLVLFPEVLGAFSARAADRLGDRARVGTPPSGAENLPTNSGVQNAVYVWPRVFFRPLSDLILRAGLLYARAVADVIDPFLTFRAGGVNRNFFDGPADRRDLGLEVQLGVRYSRTLIDTLRIHLGFEWGHLFPGDAFSSPSGVRMGDVDRFIGRLMLEWQLR